MAEQEAFVEIQNDVKLWYQSMGDAKPIILLEGPGPNCDSEPWMGIQPRLAELACTYRYDRAGTGKSSGIELSPMDIAARTRDLENFLEAASIPAPYIMTGYSLGGAIVLRYALQHLDRMAGLVLIESATESMLSGFDPEVTLPDTDKQPALGDLPLVVITIDTHEYVLPRPPNTSPEEAMQIWLQTQARLASLSSRGKQIFVKNTNHYSILESHADDIIQAILMVAQGAWQ